MNTFTITSLPYYNSCSQCYLNVLSINTEPQGPLRNFVRRINLPKLSPYKIDTPCNPINTCGLVLTNLGLNGVKCCNNGYNVDNLLTPNQIPELVSFLLANGYQIETQITNMLQNSPVKMNNNKLLLTATYYGANQPNVTYTR
uniref:Uncharacterized protein n=1 Tax=viral metagenome TaxID=1070528 RepID=A0A6C0IRY5_9ZZZZ